MKEITTDKVEVFHIQLLRSLIARWKVYNKLQYTAFIAKIDEATIESLLKNSVKLHQVEQIELINLFEALVEEKTKQKSWSSPPWNHSKTIIVDCAFYLVRCCCRGSRGVLRVIEERRRSTDRRWI